MTVEIVLKTLAILIIIKSIVILIATESIMKIVKKITKNSSLVRKISLIYLIFGILLYLLTYLI